MTTCRDRWAVTFDTIDETDVRHHLTDPGCGAVVTFAGTVRDHSPGHSGVTAIDYEVYESLAVEQLAKLAGEARSTWPDLGGLVVIHRGGLVPVGEASVVVGVTAPHRDHAFEAARFLIDVLKASLPVWKYEHSDAGTDWSRTGVAMDSVAEAAQAWRAGRLT